MLGDRPELNTASTARRAEVDRPAIRDSSQLPHSTSTAEITLTTACSG